MSQEQLVEAYLEGRIGRRTFIRRLVVAGVSLSAAVAYAHVLRPAPARAEHTPDHYEAPTVVTTDATNLAGESAILTAQVDPNRFPTTVWFEFGETAGYGSRTADQAISGNGLRAVGASVNGLDPGRIYHFRVVASNNIGQTAGQDRAFAIPDPVLPAVSVSPVETDLEDVIRAGSLRLVVKADEPSAITLEASMKKPRKQGPSRARAKRIVVAQGGLNLGAAGSDVAVLQLTKAGRRALKKVARATLTVQVSATDIAGNVSASAQRLKLS